MATNHDCTSHLMHLPCGKRHLPQPRGPHSVGFFDLMTPGDPEKSTLMRMYYPTNEQCLEEHDRWPEWVEDKYVSGLLTFMKVCYTLCYVVISTTTSSARKNCIKQDFKICTFGFNTLKYAPYVKTLFLLCNTLNNNKCNGWDVLHERDN